MKKAGTDRKRSVSRAQETCLAAAMQMPSSPTGGVKSTPPNSLAGFNGPLCGGGEGNMEGREKESDRREHHSKIKF